MNIAFFTDSYLPNKDGVVVSLLNLKKYLEKRGHKLYVFTPSPTGKEYEEDDVYYFKSTEFPPYPQYRISFPNFPKVVSLAKSLGIEVVHNHGIALTSWAALRVSKSLNIPSVTTFHTDITKATHYISENLFVKMISERIAWNYLKFLYSKFDVITAPSKTSVSMLKKHGINAVYLPNGIVLPKVLSSHSKRKNNYLLHVGRIVKEKEIDFIFPCIKKYNSSKFNRKKIFLRIVGKGPAEDFYRTRARELGIENYIKFEGFVSSKKLSCLYKNARALVFMSKFDTQGLVVIESLARGTPVIYRKKTAAEEIAAPLNLGFSSCASFFKAYKNSSNVDPKKCVTIAREFDIKKIVKKLELLYGFLRK